MGCHHKFEQYLDEYIAAAGIAEDKKSPLFRAAIGRTGKLSERSMSRVVPSPHLAHKVKFQQRYKMRNRNLSKTVPALGFCSFCNSQKSVPLVRQFLGFDSH
jgi:hypothetical protein